jgi:CDP-diacylglycerol--glycerol-3-phosphate 3-phosphatidyltransferase
MGFVAFILLPCFYAPATIVIGIAFMLPILLGFILDWLVVSGRIQSNTSTTQSFNQLAHISHNIFQPLLRALLFFAIGLFIFIQTPNAPMLVTASLLVFAGAILFGFMGRVAALGLLIIITFLHGDEILNAITLTIIFSSVWLMLLGTGRLSVWQWDDHWVNRRDGEEQS